MEVFKLCNCDNITNSYVVYIKQSANRSRKQKKSHSVNELLRPHFEMINFMSDATAYLRCTKFPFIYWYFRLWYSQVYLKIIINLWICANKM